jgi:hypothetical protein
MTDECVTTVPGWQMPDEFALELQRAYDDLTMLLSAIVNGDSDEDTPSGFPYDGCLDCETREALYLLVPMISTALEQGTIKKVDDT